MKGPPFGGSRKRVTVTSRSQDAGADIADMREQGDGEGDSAWASGGPMEK